MSTPAVFLDIEKKKTLIQHDTFVLLHKLSELKFSIRLIKLISSFLSQRKFRVSIEGEISSRGATSFRPVPHIVQSTYK
jgi:hypothetical protein